jgi:uncharacterized protein RhaS with RHS repeats
VRSDGGSTWFGWDGSSPVEESDTSGRTTRRVFEGDQFTPMLESASAGRWRLLATEASGAPWFFLDAEGAHGELELTTWGQAARQVGEPGQLRFAGQRADADTGLSYNRHRYYVPELAQ